MPDKDFGNEKRIDFNKSIELDGEAYFPLSQPRELNPCAGKDDGTSCGAGCVCRGGQCYYSLRRLLEMGVEIPDR